MASARQEQLLAALPADLQVDAVDLTEEGAAEYAFPVADSERVLDILKSEGFEIVGGDLWNVVDDGFSSSHEGWFIGPQRSSAASALHEFLSTVPSHGERYMTFVAR